MKKKAFTLLEIIIAITGFFVLMTVVINAYLSTVNYRYIFQAKSTLLETTYYMFEKINLLLKDYTIDYEEYFNRSRVGCDTLGVFT
jgi:Tfp pilus assembly protein PilE